MKYAVLTLAAVGALTGPVNAATVINFEGGTPGNPIGTISGATFTGAFYNSCGGGCPNPAFGTFAGGVGVVNPFTVTFATPQSLVSFINISFSSGTAAAYNSANNLVASVTDTQTFPISTTPLTLAGSISYIVFTATPGSGFGIDDLTFESSAVAPTPEPEAWASMALGLGLAGWVARRRKAKLAAV